MVSIHIESPSFLYNYTYLNEKFVPNSLFAGIMLGYQGMRAFSSKAIVKGLVLSEISETTLTHPPIETPTPTTTPTVTLSPTQTLSPTPKPTPLIIAPQDLEPLFEEFSITYNVDKYKLKKIADCESHFNPGVYADPYAGMYQFSESSWAKYRKLMGKDPNVNLRFGARESIETASFVLSINDESIWPSCASF